MAFPKLATSVTAGLTLACVLGWLSALVEPNK